MTKLWHIMIMLLLAATACAPQIPTAPAPTQAAVDTPGASSTNWDALVAAAKKDGELVVFLGRASTRQLHDAFPVFEQKFGIKVTQVAGSGNENADKVLAERS